MNLDYALTLIISTAISAAIALIAWRRRAAPGASGLALLMLSLTVWSLTYAIRWMSSTQTAQYFWLDATYFGVAAYPLFLTVFTLQFTDRAHLLTRRNLILLSIEPVLTLLLLWTDHWHGLFYGGFRSTGTILNGGPWFWFNVLYSYILNFMMLGLFIQAYRRASLLFRRQAGIILIGMLIPFVGNAISLGGLNPFHDLDLTPILFIVSGLVYAFGLFRYQLMDVLPVARGQLIEYMRDGLIVLDAQNRIVDINPAAQEMTGVSSSEVGKLAGITFSAWPGLAEIYSAVIETHTEISVSQNPPRDLEVRVSPLFDLQQNLSGRLIVLRDITERKLTEESEKQARILNETLIDSLPGTFYMLDATGRYVRWNAYQRDEIVGKPESQMAEANALDTIHPDDRELVNSKIANVLAHGREENVEARVLLRGGPAFRWFLMTGRQIILNGNPFLIGTGVDITERKQAEEALQVSEASLGDSQRVAHIGHWAWDTQKNQVTWSDEMKRIFGLDPVTFSGDLNEIIAHAIHPDDRAKVNASNEALLTEQEPAPMEYRAVLPDQSVRTVLAIPGDKVLDANGKILKLTGIVQDITARKQAEQALRESEESFRGYFNMGTVGMCVTSPEKGWIEVNDRLCQMLGYSREELARLTWAEMTYPDDLTADEELFNQVLAGRRDSYGLDKRFIRKDGGIIYTSLYVTCQRNLDGSVRNTLASLVDITARKQAEDALRVSETRYARAVRGSSDGMWDWNVLTGADYHSPRYRELLGYAADEYTDTASAFESVVHPDDLPMVQAAQQAHLERQEPYDVELRMRAKDGEYRWFRSRGQAERDAAGKATQMAGSIIDITERKRAEEMLRETNAYLENLINYANAPIIVWDPQFRITRFNHAFEYLTGRSEAEVSGQSLELLFPPALVEQSMEQIRSTVTGERWETVEIKILHRDQSVRTVLWNSATLFAPDGQTALATIAQGQDISERKKAEIELFEKEVQYRNLADSGVALIWRSGTDKLCNYFNQPWLNFTGRTLELEMGNGWTEGVHPDDFDRCLQTYVAAFDKHEPFDMEYRLRHVSGEYRWLQDLGTPNYNSSGEFIGYIGHCFDISERKQAEDALNESAQRLKLAIDSGQYGVWDWNVKDNTMLWDDQMFELYGITRDAFPSNIDAWTNGLHPEDSQKAIDECNAALNGEKQFNTTFRILQPNGVVKHLKADGLVIRDSEGKALRMIGVNSDITARKQVEDALRESEERHRLLADNATDVIWTMNTEGRFTYVSPSVEKLRGYTTDEVMAQTLAESLTPESAVIAQSFFGKALEELRAGRPFMGSRAELEQPCKDGSTVWTEVTTSGIHNGAGEFVGILGVTRDITERRRIEAAEREQRALLVSEIIERQRIQESEREQRLLAEALRDTAAALNGTLQFDAVLDRILNSVGRVVSHDADVVMIFLLDEAREIAQLVRYRSANDFGDTVKMKGFQFLLSQTRNLREVQMTGAPLIIADTHMYDEWNVTPLTTWIRSNLSAPIMIRGEVVGFLNLASATPNSFTPLDIEHLQVFADQASVAIQNARLYEEVQELAITDGLTKIYNRRGLFQLGEREVERALRFRHSLSIIMLDLDHFKRVNDTHGHLIGDHVLSALAERCRAQVRNVDIAARYGGEEFILLLLETEIAGAAQVAERLRQAVENMVISAEADENEIGKTVQITVSQGIATLTPDMQNLTDLIARADQVMYAAKQAGRNRVVIFEHK